MNKTQRKNLSEQQSAISVIAGSIEVMRDSALNLQVISEIYGDLESVFDAVEGERDEEQDKYDNLPEGLQNGNTGERIQGSIDALDSAADALRSAIEALEGVSGDDSPEDYSEALSDASDELGEADSQIDEAINQ